MATMRQRGSRSDVNANTQAVEDYMKAIFALESRTGEPVGTSALAERLGVSPGSASAMVKRLAEMRLAYAHPRVRPIVLQRGADQLTYH